MPLCPTKLHKLKYFRKKEKTAHKEKEREIKVEETEVEQTKDNKTSIEKEINGTKEEPRIPKSEKSEEDEFQDCREEETPKEEQRMQQGKRLSYECFGDELRRQGLLEELTPEQKIREKRR